MKGFFSADGFCCLKVGTFFFLLCLFMFITFPQWTHPLQWVSTQGGGWLLGHEEPAHVVHCLLTDLIISISVSEPCICMLFLVRHRVCVWVYVLRFTSTVSSSSEKLQTHTCLKDPFCLSDRNWSKWHWGNLRFHRNSKSFHHSAFLFIRALYLGKAIRRVFFSADDFCCIKVGTYDANND